jgi:hypothetical protein
MNWYKKAISLKNQFETYVDDKAKQLSNSGLNIEQIVDRLTDSICAVKKIEKRDLRRSDIWLKVFNRVFPILEENMTDEEKSEWEVRDYE